MGFQDVAYKHRMSNTDWRPRLKFDQDKVLRHISAALRVQYTELSFKSVEQRFHMEEDTKGRGRENFPLSFNIIAAQQI